MYVNMYLCMQICNKSRTILEKLSQSPCVIISNKWHVFFFFFFFWGGGGGGGGLLFLLERTYRKLLVTPMERFFVAVNAK